MEDMKVIAAGVEEMKSNLSKIEANATKAGADGAKALEVANEIKGKLEAMTFTTPDELKAFGKEMQDQFDALATKMKAGEAVNESKTINEAIEDGLKEQGYFKKSAAGEQGQSELFKAFATDRKAKVRIPMDVKTMLLSTNLTGVAFATQDPRPAIFPSQKINFRELINTFQTDSGLYVYWKENTGESNNIAVQTEGSIKGSNDYSFTGVSVVQQFLAGYSTFSKQMVNSLPFLTQTLPRMLMRDFYKVENANFFASVSSAATGNTSITSTGDNVEKIIYYIANQLVANYDASFALVNNADYAKLVVSTYTKGYYPGAGTVMFNGTSLTLNGVPIIQTPWVTAGHVLIIDQNFIERVQVSGLAIELSYENDQNFVKNLVTARIECQEEIVLQLAPSALYGTLA